MLNITVFADADELADPDGKGRLFEDVKYVSFVSSSTYGAPALIAPNPRDKERSDPRAKIGEEVLFINTSLVPAWTIVRTSV